MRTGKFMRRMENAFATRSAMNHLSKAGAGFREKREDWACMVYASGIFWLLRDAFGCSENGAEVSQGKPKLKRERLMTEPWFPFVMNLLQRELKFPRKVTKIDEPKILIVRRRSAYHFVRSLIVLQIVLLQGLGIKVPNWLSDLYEDEIIFQEEEAMLEYFKLKIKIIENEVVKIPVL